MTTSMIRLVAARLVETWLMLRQYPGNVAFQIFSMGWHKNVMVKKNATIHAAFKACANRNAYASQEPDIPKIRE